MDGTNQGIGPSQPEDPPPGGKLGSPCGKRNSTCRSEFTAVDDPERKLDSPAKWQNQVSSDFDKIFSYAHEIEERRKSEGSSPRPPDPDPTNQSVPATELNNKCSNWLDNYVYEDRDVYGLRIPRTPSPSHLIVDQDDSEYETDSDSDAPHVSGLNRHLNRRETEYDVPTFIDFDPDASGEFGMRCPTRPGRKHLKKQWHTWDTSESDSDRSIVPIPPQPKLEYIVHKSRFRPKDKSGNLKQDNVASSSSGAKVVENQLVTDTPPTESSVSAGTSSSVHVPSGKRRKGNQNDKRMYRDNQSTEERENRRRAKRSSHKQHRSEQSKGKHLSAKSPEERQEIDNPTCEQQPSAYPELNSSAQDPESDNNARRTVQTRHHQFHED